jgi:uncharacterized membrane protein
MTNLCSMIILNAAHWHLLLNHIPVIGTLTGFLILLSSFLFRNKTLLNTALVIFIVTALLTIPAFLTGEGAEEVLENVAGLNAEQAIELHEDASEAAMIAMQALGLLSLISLILSWMGKRNTAKILNPLICFYSLIVFAMMARVANTGGEIRHSEIRGSVMIIQPSEKK